MSDNENGSTGAFQKDNTSFGDTRDIKSSFRDGGERSTRSNDRREGGDRGRSFNRDQGGERSGDRRRSFGDRNRSSGSSFGSGRSFGGDRGSSFNRDQGGERSGDRRRSFGDRNRSSGSSFGSGRSFGGDRGSSFNRDQGGDRGRSFGGDRREGGDRGRSFGDRGRSSGASFGGGRSFGGDRSGGRSFGGDRREGGDRGRSFGDRGRSSGERSSFGGERSFSGDRSGGRSFGGDRREGGDRGRSFGGDRSGGRSSFGNRDNNRSFENKGYDGSERKRRFTEDQPNFTPQHIQLLEENKFIYQFKNSQFEKCLLHPSLKENLNFEAWEFLGDKVLSAEIALHLIKAGHMNPEELSLELSNYTCNETLAKVAEIIEDKIQFTGDLNECIRSDCLEALIGALVLDGVSISIIVSELLPVFKKHLKKDIKSPKNLLQEHLKNHAITYTYEKDVDNFISSILASSEEGAYSSTGTGKTKKEAAENAAYLLLKQLDLL